MKGLIQRGLKFQYQAGIPHDVREHFGGKKKYSVMINSNDLREAERLAAEADRHFRTKVLELRHAAQQGQVVEPLRMQQIQGYLFATYLHKHIDERRTISQTTSVATS